MIEKAARLNTYIKALILAVILPLVIVVIFMI